MWPARTRERLGHVENPERAGLRYVGRVIPETRRGDIWDSRGECGWHTDPFGDVFKDGTGLCYGVVYQLPARNGCARFVAGYEFGGHDGGPTLDFGTIFESASARGLDCSGNVQSHDDARDAARSADSMAQAAAEKEREYQTAWQAGNQFGELGETVAAERKAALALLGDMKRLRATVGPADAPAACAALRAAVAGHWEAIGKARAKRAKLASGDANGLCFYPDETLKAAFCEAAGLKAFPNG